MNNLKISTRLALGFAGIGAMLVLMGFLFLGKIGLVQREFHRVAQDHYPRVVSLHRIHALTLENASTVRNLFIIVSEPEIHKQLQQLTQTSAAIDALMRELLAHPGDSADPALLRRLADTRAAYLDSRKAMLDAFQQGLMNDAGMLLLGGVQRAQSAYFAALDEATRHEEAGMQAANAQVEAAAGGAKLLIGAILVLALAVAVLLSLRITRSIKRPLEQALELARAVAAGNLTHSVQPEGRNEIAELLAALAEMQQRLRQIVQRLHQGSEEVADASAQIASGNADLAARTESQAGTVEQTAASMEQMGATVTQNAERARQANQLAQSASGVAQQGGEVVAQVVTTMREINDSSEKIADIISVIDGIAFQTNILALNAAVEAARAGEQGRGFAVVAGEVRSLARRSAEAAKEIKTLIDASVRRVAQGTSLVDEAGQTMDEVVASIQRVTDLMGQISLASSQQSAGVAQIAEAVGRMDRGTQQNATLVDEMAAAAANLKRLADGQRRAVGIFALEHAGAPLPRLPAAAVMLPSS